MNLIENNLEKHNWTPLHTRLISHRIGDGTVNLRGHYVWDNKNADEFIELAKKLNIKIWGPTICKKYGTNEIIINKKLFQKFANIIDADPKRLLKDCSYLIDNVMKLPKDHQIQTLLALIVDDGSCKNWRVTLFEDQDKGVVDKVHKLWDSFFPNTSSPYCHITKNKTPVHHIMIKRDGIIQLKKETDKAVNKFGDLAGLWWKQKDLDIRYNKATSKRAKQLRETEENKEIWENKTLDYLKENKVMTFSKLMGLLNLSKDRTRGTLKKLIKEKKIFVTNAGSKSRYTLEKEDNSLEYRQNLILDYLKENKTISNKECRKLLNLKAARTYVTLRKLIDKGIIKQHKPSPQKTYYSL